MNRGIRELVLLAALYVGYSASRLVADDAFTPAAARALQLLDLERVVWLDVERLLNGWFVTVPLLGLIGSYWYATLHYVVTAARPGVALPPRPGRLPAGPHRAGGRHHPRAGALPDGADGAAAAARRATSTCSSSTPAPAGGAATRRPPAASAGSPTSSRRSRRCTPAGRSGSRSSYAATSRARWVRGLAWAYAAGTTIVIVGTGNHWLLDAFVGWIVVPPRGRSSTRPAAVRAVNVSDDDRGRTVTRGNVGR